VNTACTGCHATLDPVASYLWGFMAPDVDVLDDKVRYHPEQERDWQGTTGRPPGFFGVPGETLVDLGRQIAGDERFVRCAVERVFAALFGRSPTIDDDRAIAEHREAFVASGLRLQPLFASVVHDRAYRGARHRARFGGTVAPVVQKPVSPSLLSTQLFALTGFRLTWAGRDALAVDYGIRTVAGGSDRDPAKTASVGLVLATRRLAEGAAFALTRGTGGGALGALLVDFDLDSPPQDATLALVVATAHARPVAATGEEVVALAALFDELMTIEPDARAAWQGVLTAVLADPALVSY
jgi:hypothetical protein